MSVLMYLYKMKKNTVIIICQKKTFEKLFFQVFSIYFSEIFFLAHFYDHANLDFMQMLFVHVFKLFVCAYVQEKHTFVYYKKLLEEIEIY